MSILGDSLRRLPHAVGYAGCKERIVAAVGAACRKLIEEDDDDDDEGPTLPLGGGVVEVCFSQNEKLVCSGHTSNLAYTYDGVALEPWDELDGCRRKRVQKTSYQTTTL